MYVCLCNGFTDRQVKQVVEDGAATVSSVFKEIGCAPCCGRCVPTVRQMVNGACTEELAAMA